MSDCDMLKRSAALRFCVAAMNYGRLDSGMPFGGGNRVWVLGIHQGVLRSFECGVLLNCSEVTCPNPSFVFGGFGNLPAFSEPTAYWAHQTRCGGGEQTPRLSVIMLLISRSRPWSQSECV
jgi:hypothetical protein